MVRRIVKSGKVCRGQALNGALVCLAIAGAFALVAVIAQPSLIQGGWARSATDSMSVSPDRRETLENLAALIGSSAEVIAVHQRDEGGTRSRAVGGGGSPFVEIVLRLRDERGSEFIKPDEIAVISHSRVLQTIMFYGRSGTDDDVLLTFVEAASRKFCNDWRLDPAVSPRILATGVSDLRAELLHDRSGRGASMKLGLTWAGDSPDAEEEAQVTVEVRSRLLP